MSEKNRNIKDNRLFVKSISQNINNLSEQSLKFEGMNRVRTSNIINSRELKKGNTNRIRNASLLFSFLALFALICYILIFLNLSFFFCMALIPIICKLIVSIISELKN